MNTKHTYTDIISTAILAENLNDPDWIIIDCRFELANPEWGEDEYKKAHIPGALYAHLDRDLSGQITPQSSRHPLPNPQEFARRLSSWGVDRQKQVVVYDQSGGAYASRLWWMLLYFGHEQTAVLDGGYTKWLAEGREVNLLVKQHPTTHFEPEFNHRLLVSAEEVMQSINDPQVIVIDARAPARYRGEVEPIDPIAGHIPSAVNRFHNDNLSSDGTLLPAGQLNRQFLDLIGATAPENAIVYCGSGVTSCHHVLSMAAAGLPLPSLYAGSWSEWIRDPSRPTVPSRA